MLSLPRPVWAGQSAEPEAVGEVRDPVQPKRIPVAGLGPAIHVFRADIVAGSRIGIGSSLAAPPSPTTVHTGHVHGGSLDYVARTTREGRPRAVKKALGRAVCMAGVRAIRQGP